MRFDLICLEFALAFCASTKCEPTAKEPAGFTLMFKLLNAFAVARQPSCNNLDLAAFLLLSALP